MHFTRLKGKEVVYIYDQRIITVENCDYKNTSTKPSGIGIGKQIDSIEKILQSFLLNSVL